MSGTLHLQKSADGGFADDFPSLSPIIRLHIRKLYITGTATNALQLANSVAALDKDTKPDEVALFVEQNTTNPAWINEQKQFLDRQYERMIADEEKITEHIDGLYDSTLFTPLRDLVKRKITRFTQTDDEDFEKVPVKDIKTLADTAKVVYEAQREARNIHKPPSVIGIMGGTPSSGASGDRGGASDDSGRPKKGATFIQAEILNVVDAEISEVQEETALAPME